MCSVRSSSALRRLIAIAAAALAAAGVAIAQGPDEPHSPLFAPEDLGLLESPGRDEWQQPDRIMDALGIADGDRVADLGAGGGWFTVRLARRVGPNGVVYAEDIQPPMLDAIRRRIDREGLTNVIPTLGTTDDPRLPRDLDAVLMVDTYTQLSDPETLLANVARVLAPEGRLGIVDFRTDGAGGPGPPLEERVAPDEIVRTAEAAGLRLRSQETFLRYQYLLVFER